MNKPQNLLILLGFICQGLGCANPTLMVPVYVLVWLLCLNLARPRKVLPPESEAVLLAASLAICWWVADRNGYLKFIYVGNGLIMYQALRLIWPMDRRRRQWSVAIGITHIAVGTQVVFDYRFIPILIAAIILVPQALFEVESDSQVRGPQTPARLIGWREYLSIAALMVTFFLTFPRSQLLASATPPGLGQSPARQQEAKLDASRSGGSESDRLIFRISGENIGYLKTSCLDVFDGRNWSASPWVMQRATQAPPTPRAEDLSRQVTIFHSRMLEAALPTDGYPSDISGLRNLFQQPYLASHGGIVVSIAMRRQHVEYSYLTSFDGSHVELDPLERERYLRTTAPATRNEVGQLASVKQSLVGPELSAWLYEVVGDSADHELQVQRLLTRFQEEFTYEVGAPQLDQQAPVDDFVLHAQRGHCERFASALTLLLRELGIPARLVLGFVPSERNDIGGFYNVRQRHRHAWTEAYFPGQGWRTLDATPYGVERPSEKRQLILTLTEWLEYAWYAKIINYGDRDQMALLEGLFQWLRYAVVWAGTYYSHALLILLLAIAAYFARGYLVRLRRPRSAEAAARAHRQQVMREAQHFYGRLLRTLARRRWFCRRGQTVWVRRPGQTPREFQRELEEQAHPAAADIGYITNCFCDMRYGQRDLDATTRTAIEAALKRVARGT